MTEFYHKRLSQKLVDDGAEQFGITDERGRQVGIRWKIFEVKTRLLGSDEPQRWWTLPFPNTTFHTATAQVTRNGIKYGALGTSKQFVEIKHARYEVGRRIKGSRLRYIRKYGTGRPAQ